MTFQELLKDERKVGRAEGKVEDVLELLQELGAVPEELEKCILQEKDLTVLTKWVKLAARSDTIEEFSSRM